ncbi:MAG TPA: hypothetical protein VHZ95_06915 [Polyangiales bacterium]|nr:hypothetical protein [Polyangiales bacterium]
MFASLLMLFALVAAPLPAQQAQQDQDAASVEHYTATRWSMIRPNRDFQGGCVVGFLAFQFSPTGYFAYNNHTRGSWRIDEIGNLKLRTRDGQAFTLIVEGDTLRTTSTLPFIKRTDLFQRCPE